MSAGLYASNCFALKEWAVAVRALLSGRQVILIRKGGLLEKDGAFRLEHSQFFLFPTTLHEHRDRIIPEAVPLLEEALRGWSENEIVFPVYGTAAEVIWLDDWEKVRRLRPYHILSDGEVKKRFRYRDRPGIFVILLRAYTVPGRLSVPAHPDFAGCLSWVDLGTELPTRGCVPVLSDDEYTSKVSEIRSIL